MLKVLERRVRCERNWQDDSARTCLALFRNSPPSLAIENALKILTKLENIDDSKQKTYKLKY